MLLEEKLRQLRSAIRSPGPRPRSPRAELGEVSGGQTWLTSQGPCYLVEQRFPLEYCHGRIPLESVRRVSARALMLLARMASHPASGLEQALFLDTETTGLSGGTGTYAFLVGLGFFTPDAFVVQQYLMRDYAEEGALLEAVADVAARFPLVVTFNGKSFDLPLLETRYLLARRQPPLAAHLHLDLLHPARRLWRHRLPSCRLAHVEALLGHQRAGDVPSWAIPSLYFAYVRQGEAVPLQQVFDHNRQDVLSLVALAAQLGHLLAQPSGDGWSAEEVYEAARLYEEQRMHEDAVAAYERASELASDSATGLAAASRLAMLHKRAGSPELAVPIWRRIAGSASAQGLQSCVELAKYYEHQARDCAVALRLTHQALDLLELLGLLGTQGLALEEERRALEHRLARLARSRRGEQDGTRPGEERHDHTH